MKTISFGRYTGGTDQRALLSALARMKRKPRFGTSTLAGRKSTAKTA